MVTSVQYIISNSAPWSDGFWGRGPSSATRCHFWLWVGRLGKRLHCSVVSRPNPLIINPRRACSVRVAVRGFLSDAPFENLALFALLFFHIVRKFCSNVSTGFSLLLYRYRAFRVHLQLFLCVVLGLFFLQQLTLARQSLRRSLVSLVWFARLASNNFSKICTCPFRDRGV